MKFAIYTLLLIYLNTPLSIAFAQVAATSTDSCADHLNTSPDPSLDALLNCMMEMQRDIDKIENIENLLSASEIEIDSLRQRLSESPSISTIPEGAVVAFLSAETQPCPGDDWKLFDQGKGRFIVGAGQTNADGLNSKHLNQVGGQEEHTLIVEEMPNHAHSIPHGGADTPTGRPPGGQNIGVRETISSEATSSVGGNRAHNNMPPFIALYWCIRE